jgi:hypothetical protein
LPVFGGFDLSVLVIIALFHSNLLSSLLRSQSAAQ